MELFYLFESDGLHNQIIKHNKNLSVLSSSTIFNSENFLPLSGGTILGSLLVENNLSGNTFFSGSTDLSLLFAPISAISGSSISSFIQPGLNTYTGGTANLPSVNITSATLNNLSTSGTSTATQFYANTINTSSLFIDNTTIFHSVDNKHIVLMNSANTIGRLNFYVDKISEDIYFNSINSPVKFRINANDAFLLSQNYNTFYAPENYFGGTTNRGLIIDKGNQGNRMKIFVSDGSAGLISDEGYIVMNNSTLHVDGDFEVNKNLSGRTFYSGETELSLLFTLKNDLVFSGDSLSNSIVASTSYNKLRFNAAFGYLNNLEPLSISNHSVFAGIGQPDNQSAADAILYIDQSRGSGNAGGGNIVIRKAMSGNSGNVQNTLSDWWIFGADGLFTAKGDINSNKYFVSSLNIPPLSSIDAGVEGEIRFCSDGIYFCISTNTWKRKLWDVW